MKTLLITYDLITPGQKYAKLSEYLKSHDRWAHALDSTWFVITDKSPAQIRDEILTLIDGNDRLIVLDVTGDDWASLISSEINDWLSDSLPALNPFLR